jgi:hypothetical protein
MTKTSLTFFWVLWLLDVFIALWGYREFMQGVFGQYSAPTTKYISLWGILFFIAFLVIGGSLYLKNHDRIAMAFSVAAVPLLLALPYILWLGAALLSGKNARWN